MNPKNAVPVFDTCQTLQAPREPRAQLADQLLDCVLHAAFGMPPELERVSLTSPVIRISVENAEARIRHLRSCVPQLRGLSDVEVSRKQTEAWRAYAAALDP